MKSNIEGGAIVLHVNPKVYALDVVYSAAYVFLDRAYVVLDGDPKKEILVRLKPKEKQDLEKLAGEFMNELINFGDYSNRAKKTKEIREMLLQRAIITNDPSVLDDKEIDKLLDEPEDNFIDDPEGIAIPWEEKYGKNKTKQKVLRQKKH